jgi:hypothetical protein
MNDWSVAKMAENFELGKYYKHNTGEKSYMCGVVDTYTYGKCLVAEDNLGNLNPVGNHKGATDNWYEITKEEFLDGRE